MESKYKSNIILLVLIISMLLLGVYIGKLAFTKDANDSQATIDFQASMIRDQNTRIEVMANSANRLFVVVQNETICPGFDFGKYNRGEQ